MFQRTFCWGQCWSSLPYFEASKEVLPSLRRKVTLKTLSEFLSHLSPSSVPWLSGYWNRDSYSRSVGHLICPVCALYAVFGTREAHCCRKLLLILLIFDQWTPRRWSDKRNWCTGQAFTYDCSCLICSIIRACYGS